jgi:hypothetical protein
VWAGRKLWLFILFWCAEPNGRRSYVPLIGMVTIMMNDFPMLKYLMIGSLALMVLIGNDK